MGELTCPDDCTNPSQGICNGFDGTCICMPGFEGDNCSGKKNVSESYCSYFFQSIIHSKSITTPTPLIREDNKKRNRQS